MTPNEAEYWAIAVVVFFSAFAALKPWRMEWDPSLDMTYITAIGSACWPITIPLALFMGVLALLTWGARRLDKVFRK